MSDAVKFVDVPNEHWGLGSIIWSQKFMSGYPNNFFKPNKEITRAEFVSALHKYHLIMHQHLKTYLVERIKPSVVVVKNTYTNEKDEKKQGLGTGTVINAQGQVLTNYHVIDSMGNMAEQKIEVGVLTESRSDNIEQVKWYNAEMIAGDKWISEDMAVLQIKGLDRDIPTMPILAENLAEGEDVISYGHGGAYTFAVGDGVIAQDNQLVGGLFMFGQTNATINPGNSGGLISSIWKKAIAGIPTRKATSYDDINFYVPASRIIWFLENNNIKHTKA